MKKVKIFSNLQNNNQIINLVKSSWIITLIISVGISFILGFLHFDLIPYIHYYSDTIDTSVIIISLFTYLLYQWYISLSKNDKVKHLLISEYTSKVTPIPVQLRHDSTVDRAILAEAFIVLATVLYTIALSVFRLPTTLLLDILLQSIWLSVLILLIWRAINLFIVNIKLQQYVNSDKNKH